MANDVNCPMCGKTNPAGSVTCKFCGARIVPLGSAASAAPTQANPTPTPEDDTEGWLRRLRGEPSAEPSPQTPVNAPTEPPAEPAHPEDVVPDWLARIRERSRSEKGEPEEEQPAGAESSPDWLTGPPAADKSAAPVNANDDWLTRLRGSDETEQVSPAEAPAPAIPAPTSTAPAAPAANEPGRDWPSFEPAPAESSGGESSNFSTPDQLRQWLQSLDGENAPPSEAPAFQEPEAQAAPGKTSDVPDWLRDFENETPSAPIDSIPSSETGEVPGSPPVQSEAPLSIPPAGQVPDWLSAFETPEAASESGPAASPALSAPSQAFTPEEPTAASSGPFVDDQTEAVPSELPDWLKNVAPQQPVEKPETPAQAETPAWITAFDTGPGEAPAPAVPAGGEAQPPGEPISPFTGEDLPQWLSEKPTTEEAEQSGTPAKVSGLGERGIARLPEKLSLGEDEMPSLPAWLGESQPEEAAAEETSAEEIEPAQLPGWLQAMRPVEAVVSESAAAPEDVGRVERAGPLVGLRGLLTGENLVTQYQKPPTISVKLSVSDKQRINASLLENILAEESQPKKLRRERTRAPQTLMRLLVGLLLIAVLAITLFSGGLPAGLSTPILYSAETVQFNSLVSGLPQGAPVLLAVDYEAGLSGEMNVSAAAVIDQLVAKQARLVLVSTIPAGPILGQQLINAAAQKQSGYSLADKTVNLGYLAGGATSLQEFALNPKQAAAYALDSTITGVKAWDSQALLGVNGLQDFACIIVLTDNSELGRAWVEQVQTLVPSTPMLMVVSAQAAPVMQPYYESSQVKGIVAGLAGGMTYEQLRQAPGAAHAYWGAFQAGLLTAMILIIIGILFQGVLALFPASKNKREA